VRKREVEEEQGCPLTKPRKVKTWEEKKGKEVKWRREESQQFIEKVPKRVKTRKSGPVIAPQKRKKGGFPTGVR